MSFFGKKFKKRYFSSIRVKFVIVYVLVNIISLQLIGLFFTTQLRTTNINTFEQNIMEQEKILNYHIREELDKDKSNSLTESDNDTKSTDTKSSITKLVSEFNIQKLLLVSVIDKDSKIVASSSKNGNDEAVKELEAKIEILKSELETVKSDVLNREKNTRAGFVYIISNIGSFGENIFKIGMTRRLEPMDRIKELSSASVPFEFDVHALIFSDDAPALESILHSTFREYEVNKVNHRKEFFSIPLEKIEKVVTEHHNATVQWTYDAAAEEYRESLAQ